VATQTGTVTWVDASRNNGFVTPDDGGRDLFVERWDPTTGVVGTTVDFETRHVARGRVVAANVVLRASAQSRAGR
jgi:cold shock CspA family protein